MATRKTENDSRVGVWMDHHVAHLVHRNDEGEYISETITSDVDSRSRFKGEGTDKTTWGRKMMSDNESKKNNREIKLMKAYFNKLQKKLSGFNHILISGPTTASAELHHHLEKARSFGGKRITHKKAPVMTPRQLMVYMKKNLGKPMDIFREEEVV